MLGVIARSAQLFRERVLERSDWKGKSCLNILGGLGAGLWFDQVPWKVSRTWAGETKVAVFVYHIDTVDSAIIQPGERNALTSA